MVCRLPVRNLGWDGGEGSSGHVRNEESSEDRLGPEVTRMDIDPHVPLHDAVALAEIDLYTDVLAAVGEADAPLTTDELDRVLGLRPRTAQSASPMRLVLDEPVSQETPELSC